METKIHKIHGTDNYRNLSTEELVILAEQYAERDTLTWELAERLWALHDLARQMAARLEGKK